MRVAVTGSAGFIGSHLAGCLATNGHDVVPVDLHARPRLDIMEPDQLVDHLDGVDTIVHLAAQAHADRAEVDPAAAMQLNVVGSTNVASAARRIGARLLYGGTIWVYGATASKGETYREDDPISVTADRHLYTSSKIAGELVVRDFVSMYGLEATILRFGIPYGPRMREQAVLPRFCRAVLEGEPLELADGGRQGRQFLDVRDLAEGIRAAIEAPDPGPIYNLVSDEFTTIAEVAEVVMSVAGKRVKITHRDGRRGDFSPTGRASSKRAAQELGWRATIPLREGVQDYYAWFSSGEGRGKLRPQGR